MATEHHASIGGESVVLLGERALYRPTRQALLISDLHLGKADAFRRAGIGLPRGGTAHDLQRLDGLLERHPVRQLWILGDVLHGAVFDAAWRGQWLQWRERHASLDVVVVRGNHDRVLQPATLQLRDAGTQALEGGWLLRHDPVPSRDAHVVCGHLHPLCELPGLRRRFPAFWLREGVTVLPAFSHFTAGVAPLLTRGEQLVVCVEGDAVALPVVR
ncbi:MAG TPA: ligase-associated DNA damage response endonuclease PdeM [Stenotrophomonas sp.]|jgi:DNA ligase-associated metallophosphoesterase